MGNVIPGMPDWEQMARSAAIIDALPMPGAHHTSSKSEAEPPPHFNEAPSFGGPTASPNNEKAGTSSIAPIKALDLSELADYEFKEREMLLEPFLHSQDLAMIFAGRGIGKTHLAIAIAMTLATGGVLTTDWKATRPVKVLYLDGELPGSVLQERLALHLPDTPPQTGFFRAFTPDLLPDGVPLPDLSTLQGQHIIDKMVQDAELILIDNLSAWCRTGRENEAESWHPVSTWILQLRRRGVAVLLVHHAGKGGQQRGTSKREDLLDVVIGLSRPKDYDPKQGAVFELEFTKARNLTGTKAQSLEFSLIENNGRAVWAVKSLEISTFERIVSLANEGLSQAEIAAELELNKSNVSRHMRKAKEMNLLTKASKDSK